MVGDEARASRDLLRSRHPRRPLASEAGCSGCLDVGGFACHMESRRSRPMMRVVNKPWPKRAIAAVAAAALVVAAIIGAYGHASAHGGEHHAQHAGDQQAGHHHDGPAGEPCSSDHADHATCLDSMCHGGFAVVPLAVMSIAPRPAMPPLGWSRARCSALSLPLERPPRSAVLL